MFLFLCVFADISILSPQIEQHMDALHKQKASLFKKTMDVSNRKSQNKIKWEADPEVKSSCNDALCR